MSEQVIMWTVFNLVIAGVLYIDLGILNKKCHAVTLKEAVKWCVAWISLALIFAGIIHFREGQDRAFAFLTGYIIEYSLSMDNMFVFIMIFSYFNVPARLQPRVLHWGIIGAVIMRFLLIFAGIGLVKTFHWVIYLFGGLLIYTAFKMFGHDEEDRIEPEKNPLLLLFKRFMPFTTEPQGEKFFIRKNKLVYATPLFATLLVIEASDLIFAVDSIPAVIAISQDPFIVYSSNIFAILGLRSLYFLLASIMGLFCYLKYGISLILLFVGTKMLVSGFYQIQTATSLFVVIGILAISMLASVICKKDSCRQSR